MRKRYQFWFFMYPTGLPIAYSASILRGQLNEIRQKFDPQGTNPDFTQMVLVGHSMGGLLSRFMVQDPGMTYWNYAINKPYDSLDLDEQDKQLLEKMLIFDHLPFVKRVVFMCTPHRGSPMADQWYTKLAAGIVNLPGEFYGRGRQGPSGSLLNSGSCCCVYQAGSQFSDLTIPFFSLHEDRADGSIGSGYSISFHHRNSKRNPRPWKFGWDRAF